MIGILWLIPNFLGGSARPAYDDLVTWKVSGIECIVNLIAEDYGRDVLRNEKKLGFDVHYFPIRDFSAPDTMEEMDDAVKWIDKQIKGKRRTVVHCFGGIGRTSTVLISFLLAQGDSAGEAFRKVSHMGIMPQSESQLSFLSRYASRSESRL
jgi:atypical dual specificity phosphatase